MAETKIVTKTRDKVRKLLQQSFGGAFQESGGQFVGRQGSTAVLIQVLPWTAADDAQVQITGWVAQDVTPSVECLSYLLKANHDFVLGAFALEGDSSVIFRHSIVGSKLDKKELETSVKAVTVTSDKYDDIITSRFGGKKAGDALMR